MVTQRRVKNKIKEEVHIIVNKVGNSGVSFLDLILEKKFSSPTVNIYNVVGILVTIIIVIRKPIIVVQYGRVKYGIVSACAMT